MIIQLQFEMIADVDTKKRRINTLLDDDSFFVLIQLVGILQFRSEYNNIYIMQTVVSHYVLMMLHNIHNDVFTPFLVYSLMSFVLSDLVIYFHKFSYFLLVPDFILLLDILLQTSMETLNLVLLNIIIIVVELTSISCIIIYIYCSGYLYGTGSAYSNVKLIYQVLMFRVLDIVLIYHCSSTSCSAQIYRHYLLLYITELLASILHGMLLMLIKTFICTTDIISPQP